MADAEIRVEVDDASVVVRRVEVQVPQVFRTTIPVAKAALLAQGSQGKSGLGGKSAYEIAVEHGFVGTEIEWLNSLRGQKGDDGASGGGSGSGGGTGGTGGSGVSRVDNPTDPWWGPDLGFDCEFEGDDESGVLPEGWLWVNQGTAQYMQRLGAGIIGPTIKEPGGDRVRGIVRAAPTTDSWAVYAKQQWNGPAFEYMLAGLMLRDSVTGRLVTFGYRNATSVAAIPWLAPESYGGFIYQDDHQPVSAQTCYYGIRKNGPTSWDFLVSSDGTHFDPIIPTQNVQNFLNVDQIGIGYSRPGTLGTLSTHWFRVR